MDNEVTRISDEVARYLGGQPPFKLEVGAGPNGKPGWLATDLAGGTSAAGAPIVAMDATQPFPIPDASFDYVYSEHMIEHVGFDDGLNMLGECHRILKPGGALRIVTPSVKFLQRIIASDRNELEDRYRSWSVIASIIDPPAVTNAFFLNNFVRAWGHQFIYDHETLTLALRLAGFRRIQERELNESPHEALRRIECEGRLPPGFLKVESMVFEAVKGEGEGKAGLPGRNLALHCRAEQSSISPWSRERTTAADAARVVGGHWTNDYNNHTNLDERPWWRVDLGRKARIAQINVHNRRGTLDVMSRLRHFEIHVSDDDRSWQCVFRKTDDALVHGHRMMPLVWRASQPVFGRYVRIQVLDRTYLHLEQVEVYGDYETVSPS